jgi:hypothetical protein
MGVGVLADVASARGSVEGKRSRYGGDPLRVSGSAPYCVGYRFRSVLSRDYARRPRSVSFAGPPCA